MRAYQYVGLNKNQPIRPYQIKKLIEAMNISVSNTELNDIIHDADIDGDNQITFEEFKKVSQMYDWDLKSINHPVLQLIFSILLTIYIIFV